MSFFDVTPESRTVGAALATWSQERMKADGLDPEGFAVTLLTFDRPLTPATGTRRPIGFAHQGHRAFYPCSVVKVFYLAAVQACLDAGKVTPHGELDRAMRDMIRWSSNMATNYVVDLITETTGDTLLGEAELAAWVERRQWVCAVIRRRFSVGASPTRQPLQPEATGAVMEVTKWLKPSDSCHGHAVALPSPAMNSLRLIE